MTMHPHAGKPNPITGRYAHPAEVGTEHDGCSERYFYMLGERDRWEQRFYRKDDTLYKTRWLLFFALLAIAVLVWMVVT